MSPSSRTSNARNPTVSRRSCNGRAELASANAPTWSERPLDAVAIGVTTGVADEGTRVARVGNAVVVVGTFASITLPQTLRSWCGVPVAAQGDAFAEGPPDEAARRVAAELAEDGWGTVLVATRPEDLESYVTAGGPTPRTTSSAVDRWAHEPWNLPSPFSLSTLPVEP